MRNFLIHEYFNIDEAVVEEGLPPVTTVIPAFADTESDSEFLA